MSRKGELEKIRTVYERVLNENVDFNDLPCTGDQEPQHTPTTLSIKPVMGSGECESVSGESDNSGMAKSEVFNIIKDCTELMSLIKQSSIKPWMLSKLTKASDYISSVKRSLDYDNFEHEYLSGDDMNDIGDGIAVVSDIENIIGNR